MDKKKRIKRIIAFIIVFFLIPAVIILGVLLFKDRRYNLISIALALLSLIPFFLAYEKRQTKVRELVVIAVMIALTVIGRIIFYPLPGFKPVTAMVIITALCFGAEAGFLTGSMSALVSGFFFGQGPWTPFQMFVWGILGFIIGLGYKKNLFKTIPARIIEATLSGILFSVIMDIWTALGPDGNFNLGTYALALISGLPFMAIYVESNIIFLFLLYNPISQKLLRIKKKYLLFDYSEPEVTQFMIEKSKTETE